MIALEVYINKVERQLDRKAKIIRPDRGDEYYKRYNEAKQCLGGDYYERFNEAK